MNTYILKVKTKDLFSLPVAIAMKQLDHDQIINEVYDSTEGQIVNLEIFCTRNQKIMLEVALKDYILGKVNKTHDGTEEFIANWIIRGWV